MNPLNGKNPGIMSNNLYVIVFMKSTTKLRSETAKETVLKGFKANREEEEIVVLEAVSKIAVSQAPLSL